MSNDPNDILFGSGVPAAKFEHPGDTVSGRITETKARQEVDFKTREPKTFPSGDPIMGIIVTVQTALRDPSIADDDGKRRVFVEGKRMKDALREAVLVHGYGTKLLVGGELTVTFTHLGVAEKGLNAPKEWRVSYTPSTTTAANDALGIGTAAAAPAPMERFEPDLAAPPAGAPITPEQAADLLVKAGIGRDNPMFEAMVAARVATG
jgi:hypothetical protein